MDLVSIVVPFLNEEECIVDFCDFIDNYAEDKEYGVEVVFVNDGSNDNTLALITSYKFRNVLSPVKVIELSKNFGSHAAARAGFLHASGKYCTFMGADLQEPNEMLCAMYSSIVEGYDIICIEKENISAGALSRMFSLVYSWLMRKYAVKNYGLGGINNIMFNDTVKEFLNENIEANSSLNLQILDAGFKSHIIKMKYKERTSGKSKWTLAKKMKLFIDSFVAFSFMPIRLVSIIGLLIFLFGILFGAYVIINRLIYPSAPIGYTTLVSIISIGFGLTNISLGIIAEYLWRTFDAARKRPVFIVSEVLELEQLECKNKENG